MKFDRTKYSDCRSCPLNGRVKVWGEGPGRGPVPIVLLGEAPGKDEEIEARPFVGAAGRTLNYALGKAGISRRAVWIGNIVACRPTDNRSDTDEFRLAVDCCRGGFDAELEHLSRREVRVWMPLGNTAGRALGIETGITKSRGSVYSLGGKTVLPTFHPAYIVRGQWKQEVTWINDFSKAKTMAQGEYSPPKEDFNTHPSLQDLERFLARAESSHALLGVDIETTSLTPGYGEILVVGFALDSQTAISFPFFSKGLQPYWRNQDAGKARGILRRLLALPTVFQNSAFDVPHLEARGFRVPNVAHDTMLLHHVVHPELPHTIGYIVSVYGSTPYWKDGVLSRLGSLAEMDDQELRTYNLRDCVVLHQVLPGLLKDAEEVQTLQVYREISLPLNPIIMDMTSNGMPLDQKKLAAFKRSLQRKEKVLLDSLHEITQTPEYFSFDSPDMLRYLVYGTKPNQLTKALEEFSKYEKPDNKLRKDTKKYKEISQKVAIIQGVSPLRLPTYYKTRKRTPSGALSVDEEALLGLQVACNNRVALVRKFVSPTEGHLQEARDLGRTLSFITTYRRYSENAKLLSTYTSFPVGRDSRVHPRYLIHGTRTGRLASRDPNAQNIPKEVRKVFVAPPGYQIVEADYSNLELRVLAYEADDDILIDTFERGENVHDRNTRDLFGIDPDDPKWDDARRAAKVYIFGRNYGGGLRGIYERVSKEVPELGLTFEQFASVDAGYRTKHPRYTRWVRATLDEVSEKRTLRNAFGRIRIFLGEAYEIEKEGLNFPIQSAAADIINKAVISLYGDPAFGKLDAKLIGQVHDSLVFECRETDTRALGGLLVRHMERKHSFRGKDVGFPVDIKVGPSWGEVKEVKWQLRSSVTRGRKQRSSSSTTLRPRSSSSSRRGSTCRTTRRPTPSTS